MEDSLKNYYSLVNKVDDLCRQIEREFSSQLACHSGCSSCCRHITLAWVEAMALATALHKLPPNEVEAIRLRAQYAKPNGPCPLLVADRCAMYDYRPIICRTHGLPILREEAGKGLIDYCPSNFQGLETLPGNAVIDLDRLNTLLDSINRVFITEFFASKPEQERLTIAEALLLEIDTTGDTT